MRHARGAQRRGSILPLLVCSLLGLVGLVALAIDLGMLAVARTQCQAVADSVALSGARTLTGDPATDYNMAGVSGSVSQAVALSQIMGQPVQSGQVTWQVGSYTYDDTTQQFTSTVGTKAAGEAWSLVQATVTASNAASFARVFGLTTLNASAVATAAHRPRDVAIITDFSGSMRLNSLLGAPVTDSSGLSLTNRDRAMNPETVYPTWGHWTNVTSWRGSNAAVAFSTASGESIGPSNFCMDTDAGTAIVKCFFQDPTPFGSSTPAFTLRPDSYATTPGGMNFPKAKSSTAWAINVNEVAYGTGSSSSSSTTLSPSPFVDDTSPTNSSAGYGNSFVAESVGPRYWGKTFFLWPPDPRGPTSTTWSNNGAKDWRQRFFYQIYLGPRTSTSTPGGCGGGGCGGGGSGGSGGGGSSPPPPPPPPPPLNVVPPAGGKALFNFSSSSSLALGGKYPLVNNALMWSGGTDLTTASSSGSGSYRAAGTLTEFKVQSSSVTNPDTSVTTTTIYHRFTYQPNYDAILAWIKSGEQVFPPRLRAGGIVYYTAIPDTIPTNVHPLPTSTEDERNQRFWKEYIDEVLGVQQTGFTTTNTVKYASYSNIAGRMGYGDFFTWPSKTTTIRTSGRGLEHATPAPSEPTWRWGQSGADNRYMDYRDNPRRPRLQFWFGAMTLVDFLANMNVNARSWMPGTATEAPMWQCKAGVAAALNDIRKNHPNDLVSLISFSKPAGYSPTTGSTLQSGSYNSARAPLSRKYNQMINSLYFPTSVANTNTEIHPYDADIADAPKSIGGTCYAMGFMLAYNQFSRGVTDSDLRTFATGSAPVGQAGGLGRKGAQKLVIFETDGVCSATAYAPGSMAAIFQNNGPYASYFRVRYDKAGATKNEYPPYIASGSAEATTQALEVVQRLCAEDTANPPGFSTRRKPVNVHTIGFGSLFETTSTNTDTALATLQQIQYYGGVQASPSTPLESNKIIIGTSAERITKLRLAFSKIMQEGYSVTLID